MLSKINSCHLQKIPSESDVGHTRDTRKSGGFSLGKLFRKKKQRSYSEPGMHPEEEAVRRKQKVITSSPQ